MRVGDRVRVALGGRRVGGWVVAVGVEPPAGVALRPLARWSGRGPAPELIELAEWAAWRWAGRPASLLRTASPERVVWHLPPPRRARPRPVPASPVTRLVDEALARPVSLVRLPPAADPTEVPLAVAATRGHTLVVCPTAPLAAAVERRLRRAGGPGGRGPRGGGGGAGRGAGGGAPGAGWGPGGGPGGGGGGGRGGEGPHQGGGPAGAPPRGGGGGGGPA
nr:hypothetical protein [Thermoanaerobacterales bacterium]